MVKALLLLAFTAQGLCFASSTGNVQRSQSRSNSSSSSSSTAESSTTFHKQVSPIGPRNYDHAYRPHNKCKKLNEVYDPCPAPCPFRTCGINDAAISCVPAPPVGHPDCAPPTCRCGDGFYKDDYGDCVRWEDCPICENPNEIYDPCSNTCPPRTCDADEALILCIVSPQLGDPECEPGCRCIEGFVKNHNDICIPKEQCPKCLEPNTVFDPCISPCSPRRCDVDERSIKCAALPKLGDSLCEAGCRCADGYAEDYEGNCIPKDECPKCSRPHEIFNPCPPACPPQTCEIINKSYDCLDNELLFKGRIEETDDGIEIIHICDGQCVCEEGYYRNKVGECISKEDCSKCTGPHEFFSCGPACDNVCELLEKQNQTHCPIVNIVCNQKCYCEEGYARDGNNICIPIEECKASCKGDPNAKSGCGVNCNKHCRDIGKEPGPCILICYPDSCDCLEGYYLDENTGKCVLPEQCSPQCPTNEIYSECIQGNCSPQSCSQLGFPISCPRINPKYCKKGCLCKEGFVRNEDGVCIPSTQCLPQCPENEWYSECIQGNCSPQNCSQLGFSIPCPRIDPKYCKKGCLCDEGYVRNEKGVCIRSNQCPSCAGDPNKIAGCGVYCNQRCRDIESEPNACIEVCYENACNCRKGFFLDENNGLCVLPKNCTPQCQVNEYYSECTQGDCRPQNCSQLGFPISCPRIDPKYCKKGCLCEEGYARNSNGICIPSNECPSCGDDPNAQPGCGGNCNRRCSDIGKEPRACTLICEINGCDCKDGYYYDENRRRCVTREQCTTAPVCDAANNEVYSGCINGGCQAKNCSQYGKPVPCVKINPRYCIEGCLCAEGYLRASKGQCVPERDCPADICGKNEVFEDCSNPVCRAKNCTDVGFPLDCKSPCIKGCVCQDGYVRDKNERCIPVKQCPTCGGDPNAEPGCGGNCGKRCSDIGKRLAACPFICLLNSCDCKPGYYYDDNTKRCVKKEDCSPICLEQNNEVYSNCINGGCSRKNCSQYGKPVSCVKINPKYCIKGCLCKKGYLRAANGKCIPQGDCRARICGKNKVFEDCSDPICRVKNCTQLGFSLDCDKECMKGCVCKDGYARNNKGKCIPVDQCPSCGGDRNAKSGCGVNCLKKCHDLQNPGRPRLCPRICKVNACDCKEGYYLDENVNKCVRSENCTPSCGNDEIYTSCINGGCEKKNCSQLGKPQICIDPIKCLGGCICKEGFLRLKNGTCVPYDQCPTPKCKKNERYELCPAKLCQPQSCWDIGFPIDCPGENDTCPGYPECICDNDYVRNDKGICGPKSECPSCGGDPNAKSGCGINCGKRCPNNNLNPKLCPRICLPNRCDCKDGFNYDINIGSCVKLEDCSPRCDELNHEVYDSCVNGGCGWRNCSQVGGPQLRIDPIKCSKGCRCEEGYYRLNNGTCVPEKQCPKT